MTSLCLLNIVRRMNITSKVAITKLSIESSSGALNSMAVLTVNLNKNYTSLANGELKKKNQEDEIQNQILRMYYKFYKGGALSKCYVEQLWNDIKISGKITSAEGLVLLQFCSKLMIEKTPESIKILVDDVWDLLKKFDVMLDISHYNALLTIYVENEYDFLPENFLKELIDANIEPNQTTFELLISYNCNYGKMDKANFILEHMKKNNIPLTEEILSSLVYGHFINNNIHAALETMENIKLLKIKPTITSYSTLMYAYARRGDIETIKKILTNCEAEKFWIPDGVLLTIVYHLSINGFEEHIEEILSLVCKESILVPQAMRIICKLIEKKQEDIAFRIFQDISHTNVNFLKEQKLFMKALINFNVSEEKMIQYCQKIENMKGNQIVLKSFLFENHKMNRCDSSIAENSLTLLRMLKESGGKVGEHYFYSIFKIYNQTKDYKSIEMTLKKMILDFNLQPSVYMLSTYILPFMQKNYNELLYTLINCQVNSNNAANSILMYLLSENKVYEAIQYMSKYNFSYKMETIKRILLQSFKNTGDVSSFVWILHYFYKFALDNTNFFENIYFTQLFIDSCVLEAIDFLPHNDKYLILMFFRTLINKGLNISPNVIEIINNKLENSKTPEIINALNILKSGQLVPTAVIKPVDKTVKINELLDIAELENIVGQCTITNKITEAYLKNNLLIHYCRINKVNKVNKLLKQYKESHVRLSLPVYKALMNMYLNFYDIQKTEFWFHELMNKFPNFLFNSTFSLKFATILVKCGEIEKAQKYITYNTYEMFKDNSYKTCKLLYAVSEYKDEDLLHKFFDLLIANGYITELKESHLEPFIKFHLSMNNVEAAYQKFKWVSETYQLTPASKTLMNLLLKKGDEKSLKELILICIKNNGEVNTAFNVAMTYLENGDLTKAEEIIKNNCEELSEEHVRNYAKSKCKSGEVIHLQNLFKILNNLKYDVEMLCSLLLKYYGMENKWSDSYHLWMKMLKENIQPSKDFLNILGEILAKKNIDMNKSMENFNCALKHKDYVKATELLNSLPIIYKSECYSLLCKKYIESKQFSRAVDLWQDLNEQFNLDLTFGTAEFVLKELVHANSIENIQRINNFLSPIVKQRLNFNFYLNTVYLQTGFWSKYLKQLETDLSNGKINVNNLNMHYKTVIKSLMNYSDICEEFEQLANKFVEKNIHLPINALWVYYFIQQNPKANEIWVKHIRDSQLFYWLQAINFVKNSDSHLYVNLAKLLRESSLRKNIKLNIYTKLMNNCIELNMYKYSLEIFLSGLSEFPMDEFDIDILVKLEMGLKQSGIPWPWSANEKKTKIQRYSNKTIDK